MAGFGGNNIAILHANNGKCTLWLYCKYSSPKSFFKWEVFPIDANHFIDPKKGLSEMRIDLQKNEPSLPIKWSYLDS